MEDKTKRCPGSSQDRVSFCIAGRGHGQDPRQGRRALFPVGAPVAEVSNCLLSGWGGLHLNSLFLIPSVSTAAVNICFLISSLFPVNCTYLDL